MPVTSPSTSSVGSVDDQGIPPIADMAARLHPGHDRTYQRLRDLTLPAPRSDPLRGKG
jgi:hypothetical protein